MTTGNNCLSLVSSKLFADLEEPALKHIFESGRLHHLPPKTDIVVTGSPPEHLYLLQHGRARSYILSESGSEVVLLWLSAGGVIGLASLLDNPPNYMINATTVSQCEVLVWNHDTIRRLARTFPQIIENGFNLALDYLKTYMTRHLNVVTKSAESRLAQRLLQLASETGVVQSPGIAIDITNEQLSSLSDISTFTTSRLLARWEREKWLIKHRGRVTLLAPEDLEAVVAA